VLPLVAIAITSLGSGGCSMEDSGLLPAGGGGASARGGGGAGGTAGSSGGVAAGIPCDVAALLANRCVSCHGVVPTSGAPMSLVSFADLVAPARSNPAVTVATLALTRMQSATAPMPPAPAARATAAEIAALQSWNAAGDPASGCATDAGVSDPFSVPPTCTSQTSWTGGTRGSPSMNPGLACIACHATTGGEAPLFALAGTVYPTAHEPDLCNGVNGATVGAQVVIAGADGQTVTLSPNAAGNFSYQGTVALPFQAKVVFMGRERVMTTPQSSGDCNSCHTQSGASGAPGRILLP
jgi:hypothetical protein